MKAINQKLKFCGVYLLTNLVNGSRYVGSSKNIYQRLLTHRSYLRHGKHVNSHLQNAWNLYGEDNFEYSVLEKCDENIRIQREQYYIDTLKPEYNIVLDDISLPPYSEESRLKHSKTKKRMYKDGTLKPNNCKYIYVYDLEGNYLKSYNSISKASRDLNIYYGLIRKVLKGLQKQCHGYMFSFTKEEHMDKYVRTKDGTSQYKTVYVYNENEYYSFECAEECAQYFNVCTVYVRDAILHNRKFLKKYTISYTDGRAIK